MSMCPQCAPFWPSGWECGLQEASREPDSLQAALDRLVPQVGQGTGPTEVFRCPDCGAFFLRTYGQEWDSFDEVVRDLVRVVPLEADKARALLEPEPQEPQFWAITDPGFCPRCGSNDLERLREMPSGTQVLVWCRCRTCGREEFMDCYDEL